MDFTLSKEHEMARTLFREFAEKEVKPLAIEVDETEEFPRETVEKMAKAGFMGIPIPKEYGGQGCDVLTYAMCVEELAKVCGTTAVIVSAHTSLCCDPILTYGTEEQKQKYLPDLASGKKIGAFGLTSGSSIETITEYIDAHSDQPLKVEQLAIRCNMSYSFFAKQFRQIYGRSCKEYIEYIRVIKTEDMLLYTDYDMTYISQAAGFSDCSHMIKTFRKYKNITPKQFRIQNTTTSRGISAHS